MQTQLDEFNNQLLAQSQYVLVDFSASWCGLCRMIQPILGRLSAEWGDALKLVQLDADEHLILAYRYQIRTLPTLLLFKNGIEIKRYSHFSNREDFIYRCERLMQEDLLYP